MQQAATISTVDMNEFDIHTTTHRIACVEPDSKTVTVTWDDGYRACFHYIWLRDNCPCHECRHPQTRERTFQLIQLPNELPAHDATVTAQGALKIEWEATHGLSSHTSLFDPAWLRAHHRHETPSHHDQPEAWDAGMLNHIPTVDHRRFMHDETGMRDWLEALIRYGIAFIVDGPTDDGEVIRIAERVGWPRESNFGRHFDVQSKPNPNNTAYTQLALEPHVDLPNWRRPPDYQLLYCLQNAAEGGASLLTDGLAVAQALREQDPEAFELLATQPVDFLFQDETSDIRFSSPTISLGENGEVSAIRFNNWIRGVLDLPEELTEPFYLAYRKFWELLRDPQFMIRFPLAPGQMIAFDNLRVLHGREAFDPNSGPRHLQGTYLDKDLILSRLRITKRRLKQPQVQAGRNL